MFLIKKTFTAKSGKEINVLMTNGHSEILEIKDEDKAHELTSVMNENSENNCSYEVVGTISKKKS